jgi:phosphoenolpyruvate-protein phosphotransferase
MSKVNLVAPLAGWSTPLDEAPDAVFAGRMLGDGLAIDPTGAALHAPCDGELIAVPESRHAVTLRSPQGAEILLHVGIDTVGLGGAGFELHVRQGQHVRAGERLLSFDLDLLARRALSVLTPVIVLEGGGFTISGRNQNRELNVGDFLMELTPGAAVVQAPGPLEANRVASRRVLVALEHGIHARPAAALAGILKRLAAQVSLVAHGREASAHSAISLMTLGVRKGDEVEIRASGSDAAAAVAAVESALRSEKGAAPGAATVPRANAMQNGRAGESDFAATSRSFTAPGTTATASGPAASGTQASGPSATSNAPSSKDANNLRGVIASRGLAVGHTLRLSRSEIRVPEDGSGVAHETAELDRARSLVRARLQTAAGSGPEATREIIGAHLELLDDPELVSRARIAIGKGKSAAYAWRQVIRATIDALRALQDARMAERVDDLLDLESQVLGELCGAGVATTRELPENTVLIARELLPSQLVAVDASHLAGICMGAGGPTSHVAILAAAMGIPVLVAMGPEVLALADGTAVVLDAERGVLRIDPDRAQMAIAEGELNRRRERRAAERAAAQRVCRTADGTRIQVLANLGSVTEAEAAVRNGAEGCGLLRTEFLFLERQSPPDEAEQAAQYQRIATALGGRPLTLRTLDIGGDKPIPYLPLPREDNPALGLRGVRTSLWRPDLLRAQLRAVLAIRPDDQARILLPMITDPAEIRTVRGMLDEERANLGRSAPIELGVMIETPAAAVMSDRIAAEADFLSIGTNDLTQYTLAMDRGHPELAARLDALHPAVLRLIARAAEAAISHGRHVAVCGGLASDPTAAPILIGLGVQELSMVPSVIPQLKALIGGVSLETCRELARQALELESAEAVRALALRMVSGFNETAPVHE